MISQAACLKVLGQSLKAAGGGSFQAEWEKQEKEAQGKMVPDDMALCNQPPFASYAPPPKVPRSPENSPRTGNGTVLDTGVCKGPFYSKLQQESEDIRENLKGKVVRLLYLQKFKVLTEN